MSLGWAHMPLCWFCHEAALILFTVEDRINIWKEKEVRRLHNPSDCFFQVGSIDLSKDWPSGPSCSKHR